MKFIFSNKSHKETIQDKHYLSLLSTTTKVQELLNVVNIFTEEDKSGEYLNLLKEAIKNKHQLVFENFTIINIEKSPTLITNTSQNKQAVKGVKSTQFTNRDYFYEQLNNQLMRLLNKGLPVQIFPGLIVTKESEQLNLYYHLGQLKSESEIKEVNREQLISEIRDKVSMLR